MLAINTYNGKNQAISIDPNSGHVNMGFYFPGNTEVHQSCSVVFNDKMFIFGGQKETRQIAEVSTKCGINRIGDLPFDFVNGACTIIKGNYLMLCFDMKEGYQGKVCRIDKSPTGSFDKINKESNFNHYRARVAAIDGKN